MTQPSAIWFPDSPRTLSASRIFQKTRSVMSSIPSIESRPTHMWLWLAERRLKELASLGPGWDGGTAIPADPTIIDGVLSFISSDLVLNLEVKPDIVPTVEGGLLIEWHSEAVDLIIESSPSGQASFYFCDNETDDEVEAPLGEQMESLRSAFAKLGFRP